MNASNIYQGSGDKPDIPVEPIKSCHDDRSSSIYHFDEVGEPIVTYFDFHETIGKGSFSKVKRVRHRTTKDVYAVKIVDKSKLVEKDVARVMSEIQMHASANHPCICKLYSVFYTQSKIFMVLEYCETDLFEYIVKLRKPLSETKGRRLFIQLLSAISYLHANGIAHRDIKPENILLTGSMKQRLKLCDFGFSRISQIGHLLSTPCGSLAYGAPEVILGKVYCGMKADVWSLGVNLYVMLTSKQPFSYRNGTDIRAQILSGRVRESDFRHKPALNLIKRLLSPLPHDRPSTEEIWNDPWLQAESEFLAVLKFQYGPSRRIGVPEKLSNKATIHLQQCVRSPIRQFLHSSRRQLQRVLDLFSIRKRSY